MMYYEMSSRAQSRGNYKGLDCARPDKQLIK